MMTIKQRLDAYERLMRLDKPIGALLLLWPAPARFHRKIGGVGAEATGEPDPLPRCLCTE